MVSKMRKLIIEIGTYIYLNSEEIIALLLVFMVGILVGGLWSLSEFVDALREFEPLINSNCAM